MEGSHRSVDSPQFDSGAAVFLVSSLGGRMLDELTEWVILFNIEGED
jgi:hypothetical protein